MTVMIDDEFEEALEAFYCYGVYCEQMEELMKDSLAILKSGRKEIEQERSKSSRMEKKKKLLKILHKKSTELYDLAIDIFASMVRAEAEIRGRLIHVEVEEIIEKENRDARAQLAQPYMNWQHKATVLHEMLKEEKNPDFRKALINLKKFAQLVAKVNEGEDGAEKRQMEKRTERMG